MAQVKTAQEKAESIVKASVYVAISSVLAYLIGLTTDTPDMFGVYTPIINIILVTIKQAIPQHKG